mmetsp:Transcript_25878/g.55096  ORF Transcript_25878/g.55096 Transcript_25878/m.55096 type:complete len:212 (-) Transcript_25878:863-1498(-)
MHRHCFEPWGRPGQRASCFSLEAASPGDDAIRRGACGDINHWRVFPLSPLLRAGYLLRLFEWSRSAGEGECDAPPQFAGCPEGRAARGADLRPRVQLPHRPRGRALCAAPGARPDAGAYSPVCVLLGGRSRRCLFPGEKIHSPGCRGPLGNGPRFGGARLQHCAPARPQPWGTGGFARDPPSGEGGFPCRFPVEGSAIAGDPDLHERRRPT